MSLLSSKAVTDWLIHLPWCSKRVLCWNSSSSSFNFELLLRFNSVFRSSRSPKIDTLDAYYKVAFCRSETSAEIS